MKNENFVINSLEDEVNINIKSIYKTIIEKGIDYTFNHNGMSYYAYVVAANGKINIKTKKEYNIELKEGEAIFLWGNDLVSYTSIEEESRYFWVWFALGKKTLPLNAIIEINSIEKTINDLNNCIKYLKRANVLDVMHANMIFTKYIVHGVEELESKKNESISRYRVNILQSVDYINDNLYDLPTIQELANAIGMSIKQYRKYFKQVTGVYPAKYIYNKKLASVKDSLVNTDLSINEISDMMGFSSPYYLSNCFKNTFGVTPSEYRKKHSK